MPNTLIILIVAGLSSFIALMFVIIKGIMKLRKEELTYFPKPIKIEISETYVQFEIVTYNHESFQKFFPKRPKLQRAVINNSENFEFINEYSC